MKYIIEGNHPIFKYINWTADDETKLNEKVNELMHAGYEINIKPQLVQDSQPLNESELLEKVRRIQVRSAEQIIIEHLSELGL
jgi:uncharacterized protein (UPF0128 family)